MELECTNAVVMLNSYIIAIQGFMAIAVMTFNASNILYTQPIDLVFP